jgi:hypothetical protein
MKKILFIISFFVSFVSFGQVYQLMPQYGYQANRMNFDSTLQIPTTCGVPTLRTVVNVKRAAIAFDSCNNRFYQYNPKTSSWSVISGVDTTSLSNRINTKIDSLKRSRDSVFAKVNGVWRFQYKDSIGGGSTPSLQAVTDVGASTINMITASTNYATTEYNKLDAGNQVYYPFYATDGSPIYPNESYIRMGNFGGLAPEFYNGSNGGGSYNKLTPTYLEFYDNGYSVSIKKPSGVSDDHYLPVSDNTTDTLATTSDVAAKVNINDTALMLLRYLRKVDTASLSNRINTKLNISDTTNKWVTSVTKLNDSTIRVVKNTTTTDITLTPAATVTAATRLITSVYNNSGSTITKGSVVYINGRHSSNLPTIALAQANTEANSYSTFALVQDNITNGNSGTAIQAGNIGNLNLPTSSYTDGEVIYLSPTVAGGLTTNKTSVLAPNHIVKIGTITRAHPTAGSIEIKIENGWQMDELSDVQISAVPNDSTLLQFSRVDSLWHAVSVNNAIGTKYIKPSDTASMLTPYLRKVDTTAKFVNSITRTAGKDSIIFFIGGTRYAIKDSVGGGGGSAAGSTGNVQYNNGGAFAGSNNLFWDNTNSRLGIGTASPTVNLNVQSSTNTGITARNTSTSGRADLLVTNDAGNVGGFTIYGSTFGAPFSNNVAVTSFKSLGIYTDGGVANSGTSTFDVITGGYNNSPTMRITGGNTGNVLIGTSTDAGFKLDVNGTARAVTSLQTPTLLGNTTSGGTLTLQSTSNATKGKILFGTSAYDEVNSRLGIGTASPTELLQLNGTSTQTPQIFMNANGASSNDQGLYFGFSGNKKIGFGYTQSGGNRFYIYNIVAGGNDALRIYESSNNIAINSTSDAGYKFDVNGTARVQGALNFNPTNTASGTTGNQTINKASGTVNIAAAGTSITVTNSLVTTSSIVFATIRTNDATAVIKNVVPAAGSFTINLNAAATAETSIGFFVIN